MRLLLDEIVPAKLTGFFAPQMEATTVARRGWSGIKNGELMRLAQHEFDVLVTMDRGILHQQNLGNVDLAILLLEAPSNRLADLVPLVEKVQAVLSYARPGDVLRVQGS